MSAFSVARCRCSRSSSTSNGLVTYQKAPSFMASIAVFSVLVAVSMMIGRFRLRARSSSRSFMPSIPGMRMSSSTTSADALVSVSSASSAELTAIVSYSSFSVIRRDSRTPSSSSTTSTLRFTVVASTASSSVSPPLEAGPRASLPPPPRAPPTGRRRSTRAPGAPAERRGAGRSHRRDRARAANPSAV